MINIKEARAIKVCQGRKVPKIHFEAETVMFTNRLHNLRDLQSK